MRPSLRLAAGFAALCFSTGAAQAQYFWPSPYHNGMHQRQGYYLNIRNGPYNSITIVGFQNYYSAGYGFVPYYYTPFVQVLPLPYFVQQPAFAVPALIPLIPDRGNGVPPDINPPVKKPKAPALPGKFGPVPKPMDVGEDPPAPRGAVPGRAEADKVVDAGRKAFADGQYGRALELFRRAAELTPNEPSNYFNIAQAQFALGKYREAVAAVAAGMALRPDWSDARFSPRDLYAKNPAAFDDHLKALRQAAESFADDSRLAFLLGHQLWFDGQRDEAKALILKARAGGKVTPAEAFELK